MTSKREIKFNPVGAEQRQIQAIKITRLRALRLAKEAADREAAALAAADRARKPAKRARSPAPAT